MSTQLLKALVKTLFYRRKSRFTVDTLEEELMNVKRCLKNIGYPLKFIEEYAKREYKKPKEATVNNKPVFIQLKSKGDDVWYGEPIRRRRVNKCQSEVNLRSNAFL